MAASSPVAGKGSTQSPAAPQPKTPPSPRPPRTIANMTYTIQKGADALPRLRK
jgi:hypothetical protein